MLGSKAARTPVTGAERNGGIVGAAVVAAVAAGGIAREFRTQHWGAAYGATVLAMTLFIGSALGFGIGVSAVHGESWLGAHT